MNAVKLWLANRIVDVFYGILAWSMKQRIKADLKAGVLVEFVPVRRPHEGYVEHQRMN